MGRYTIRRVVQMVPVVIGTTLLIFVMVWALPGDPFAGKCGDRPCPPQYVAQKTEEFNLNEPWYVQYVLYMGNLIQGDFGETVSGLSVADELARTYPTTVKLAALAILIEIVIGIGAGVGSSTTWCCSAPCSSSRSRSSSSGTCRNWCSASSWASSQ